MNESGFKFTVVGERRIRFGLGAVRNVGEGAIASIIAGRQQAPTARSPSWWSGSTSGSATSGCSSRWSPPAPAIRWAATASSSSRRWSRPWPRLSCSTRSARPGQASLFGGGEDGRRTKGGWQRARAETPFRLPDIPAWTEAERLAKEKEVLGFFISGHPLERFRDEVELFGTRTTATLGEWGEHQVSVAAVVTAVKRQISKKTGKEYARLVVEDFHGTAEAIVFPDAWAKLNQTILPDSALLLTGGYSDRDRGEDRAPFVVEAPSRLDQLKPSGAIGLSLSWKAPGAPRPTGLRRPRPSAPSTPGPVPLYIEWSDGNGESMRLRSRRIRVAADDDLLQGLRALLGPVAVHYVKAG